MCGDFWRMRKLKKTAIFALIAALFIMLLLCSCGGNAESVVSEGDVSSSDVSSSDIDAAVDWYDLLSEEERQLANVVLSSTDAFNSGDEAAYMATVDPESEAYDETLEYIKLVFKKYSLTAQIESIEVVEAGDTSAELRVVQTTVRNGSEGKKFTDVRTVLLHTMVCRDGVWYISATTVESRAELTAADESGEEQLVSASDVQ